MLRKTQEEGVGEKERERKRESMLMKLERKCGSGRGELLVQGGKEGTFDRKALHAWMKLSNNNKFIHKLFMYFQYKI